MKSARDRELVAPARRLRTYRRLPRSPPRRCGPGSVPSYRCATTSPGNDLLRVLSVVCGMCGNREIASVRVLAARGNDLCQFVDAGEYALPRTRATPTPAQCRLSRTWMSPSPAWTMRRSRCRSLRPRAGRIRDHASHRDANVGELENRLGKGVGFVLERPGSQHAASSTSVRTNFDRSSRARHMVVVIACPLRWSRVVSCPSNGVSRPPRSPSGSRPSRLGAATS